MHKIKPGEIIEILIPVFFCYDLFFPKQYICKVQIFPGNSFVTAYDDLFTGFGHLNGVQVKVLAPVAQPLRRLPIFLQNKIESKIGKLLELKV